MRHDSRCNVLVDRECGLCDCGAEDAVILCDWCEEEILPKEHAGKLCSNASFHTECLARTVLGSVGHQNKTCSCFGGTLEDPPGMTKREAAKAAVQRSFK